MNRRECEIVRDLLPNYIDKLTSKETNEFIEEHIKTCEDCTKTYNTMKDEFYKQEKNEKESINFFKKHKKKLDILRILVIILLFILLGLSIYTAKIFRNNFEETAKTLYKTIEDLEEAGYTLVTIVEEDGTIRKDIIPVNEVDIVPINE